MLFTYKRFLFSKKMAVINAPLLKSTTLYQWQSRHGIGSSRTAHRSRCMGFSHPSPILGPIIIKALIVHVFTHLFLNTLKSS